MADNFDLKKFLKESKALENLNPSMKSINEGESREERADVDKFEFEKLNTEINDNLMEETILDEEKYNLSSEENNIVGYFEDIIESKKN